MTHMLMTNNVSHNLFNSFSETYFFDCLTGLYSNWHVFCWGV